MLDPRRLPLLFMVTNGDLEDVSNSRASSSFNWNLNASGKRLIFRLTAWLNTLVSTPYISAKSRSIYFLFCGIILQFGWQGFSLALLDVSFGLRSRVDRVPTSYPTGPSRKLMGPAANARTDPKVYVDCRGDYRISAMIYTNRLSASRDSYFAFSFTHSL